MTLYWITMKIIKYLFFFSIIFRLYHTLQMNQNIYMIEREIFGEVDKIINEFFLTK
jgi:cell division protein FtsL